MSQRVVITGATKGLGLAMAHAFAVQGAALCVCARTEADLIAQQATFETLYPSIQFQYLVVDVAQKDQILGFADFILTHFGTPDVLINNAGLFLSGNAHNEPNGTLEQLIETNLYSAYHLSRALIPALMAAQKGHIFNVGSVAGLKAFPGGGAYSISKFALHGLTRALRDELKDQNIKVTLVMPGAAWSDSWKGVDLPRARLMEAEDVAKMVVAATQLSASAVVEDIILRPILGDL